jgi:hypothetical protein
MINHRLILIRSPRPMNTLKLQYPANSYLQVWQVTYVGALVPGHCDRFSIVYIFGDHAVLSVENVC